MFSNEVASATFSELITFDLGDEIELSNVQFVPHNKIKCTAKSRLTRLRERVAPKISNCDALELQTIKNDTECCVNYSESVTIKILDRSLGDQLIRTICAKCASPTAQMCSYGCYKDSNQEYEVDLNMIVWIVSDQCTIEAFMNMKSLLTILDLSEESFFDEKLHNKAALSNRLSLINWDTALFNTLISWRFKAKTKVFTIEQVYPVVGETPTTGTPNRRAKTRRV
jgi:hypothetical protein